MSLASVASCSRSVLGAGVGGSLSRVVRAASTAGTATRSIPKPTTQTQAGSTLPPPFLLPSLHIRTFSTTSAHDARTATSSTTSTTASSSSTTSKPELAFPSHLAQPTPYQVFHFTSRAVSASAVKARYYDLVRTCHPDSLTGKPKVQAEEEFKTIIAAYNLLKDPQSKMLYDRAGIGWGSASSTSTAAAAAAGAWVDPRYRRKRSGHDRYDWQNSSFYSSHFTPSATSTASAGWQGGNRSLFGLTNGVFISTLFILTWFLAGLQYSRLSLQSQKAIERADKAHLDAAKSLQDARREARSTEGRQRWDAYRRRAREARWVEELERGARTDAGGEGGAGVAQQNPYGIGHGGPSGKAAALERFAQAQAAEKSRTDAAM